MDKSLTAILGVWGVLAFSWANNGLTLHASETPTVTASSIYQVYDQPQPLEAASEAYNAPEATTTTISTIADCDDVVALAAALGWPASELKTLRRVANAESACMPWAHNVNDPNGGSYGIMQVNGFWCIPNRHWPTGWLQAHGIVATCDDLFSATTNLLAALAIWQNSTWTAWTTY